MQAISLYSTSASASQAGRRAELRHPAQPLLDSIIATVQAWRKRHGARAELLQLDHRMLRDIGVTPGDALHEANKPFWRE